MLTQSPPGARSPQGLEARPCSVSRTRGARTQQRRHRRRSPAGSSSKEQGLEAQKQKLGAPPQHRSGLTAHNCSEPPRADEHEALVGTCHGSRTREQAQHGSSRALCHLPRGKKTPELSSRTRTKQKRHQSEEFVEPEGRSERSAGLSFVLIALIQTGR